MRKKNEAKANEKQTLFPNRIKIIEISLIRLNINTTPSTTTLYLYISVSVQCTVWCTLLFVCLHVKRQDEVQIKTASELLVCTGVL